MGIPSCDINVCPHFKVNIPTHKNSYELLYYTDYRLQAKMIILDHEKLSQIICSQRNQSSDILQHSQNRPTGDRRLKF